jgi:hypothetical protein
MLPNSGSAFQALLSCSACSRYAAARSSSVAPRAHFRLRFRGRLTTFSGSGATSLSSSRVMPATSFRLWPVSSNTLSSGPNGREAPGASGASTDSHARHTSGFRRRSARDRAPPAPRAGAHPHTDFALNAALTLEPAEHAREGGKERAPTAVGNVAIARRDRSSGSASRLVRISSARLRQKFWNGSSAESGRSREGPRASASKRQWRSWLCICGAGEAISASAKRLRC